MILADAPEDGCRTASYNRLAMLLYYITDRKGFAGSDSEQRAALLKRVAAAARTGVDYIQLREKDLPKIELEDLTRKALRIVRDHSGQTKLLINTHADIALAIGADGVHLPSGSSIAFQIRAGWLHSGNRDPLIGVSAHSIEDVRLAESDGVNFAVFAPIFEKVGITAKGIGLDALREACALSTLPILALGGVNLANAQACLDAGAAGLAGIRLFQQGEVSKTVNALRELDRGNTSPLM